MPNALFAQCPVCPMPNPQCPRTPHVTEKGYTMQSLGSELKRDETTLVLVSGKREITKEWKFLFIKIKLLLVLCI